MYLSELVGLKAGRTDSGLDTKLNGNKINDFWKICDLVNYVILLSIFSVLSGKRQGPNSQVPIPSLEKQYLTVGSLFIWNNAE